MLDKSTAKFLKILAQTCADGSYKIIEKAELARDLSPRDPSGLDKMISYLKDNEMVDVKYSDETVYCLTVLPRGRVTVEALHHNSPDAPPLANRTMLLLVGSCFLAAVLGALIGTLIANLF